MAVTYSEMISLGAPAPEFELPDANPLTGRDRFALNDVKDARLVLVVFTCNHCPYVQHIEPALTALASSYDAADVAFVAISSNDSDRYPADSFDAMRERARMRRFPFPYLFDESQEVARAYGAVCTPDFFLFDDARRLIYRGRFDDTRPGKGTAHGGDLRQAIDQALKQGNVTLEQHPSMGCSIKWKDASR